MSEQDEQGWAEVAGHNIPDMNHPTVVADVTFDHPVRVGQSPKRLIVTEAQVLAAAAVREVDQYAADAGGDPVYLVEQVLEALGIEVAR